MDPYGKDAVSVDVGQRLRLLREERNISMRALARQSGLSANALSMIERNLTSPSVSTLNKLANAMGVPITAFFRQEPVRSKIVYRRASERMRVPFLRGVLEGLGGESFDGHIEAFLITLDTGGSSGPHSLLHSGHEFVFCLRGALEFEVGDERFTLNSGDSLIFSSQLTHRWRNNGVNVANAIIIIADFDESERPGEFHMASVLAASEIDDILESTEEPPEEI